MTSKLNRNKFKGQDQLFSVSWFPLLPFVMTSMPSFSQDCAGVILYSAENATHVALDAIQILGRPVVFN